MRRTRSERAVLAALAALLLGAAPARAEGPPASEGGPAVPELETHAIAVLVAGPAAKKGAHLPPELGKRHLAYILDLVARGVMVGGPVSNPRNPSWAGLSVFRAASGDEARRIAEGDPAVKAGWFRVEILEWKVEKGVLGFPRAGAPR